MPHRLLIVDDDPTIRTSLGEALASNEPTAVRGAEGPVAGVVGPAYSGVLRRNPLS